VEYLEVLVAAALVVIAQEHLFLLLLAQHTRLL
jgi:hypothetical protein